MNWLKKILGMSAGSKEEKIARYMELMKSMDVIESEADELADSFRLNKSMVDNVKGCDMDEMDRRLEKFDEFMMCHKQDVHELLKAKMEVEDEMKKLKEDPSIAKDINDIDTYFKAKKEYKARKSTLKEFNDSIRKAKEGPVKYSDALVFDGNGKLLILHRIQDGKHCEGGEWCIPGGHVDPGEEHREAAERELKEETGLKLTMAPDPAGFYNDDEADIHYYRAFTEEMEPSILVDSTEHDGVEWIDLKDIDKYDFIFDMKDSIKKLLGMEEKETKGPDTIEILAKALKSGQITPAVFKEAVEKAKNKTYFSEKERGKLAKEGEAMPDGKYPIRNAQDLKDAIKLVGASSMPESEVKAWIKKRARELNLENELPEDWRDVEKAVGTEQAETIARESLDGETKDDRVEKSSFSIRVDFDDLEKADLFKSMVEKYKSEGDLGITSVDVIDMDVNEDKEIFRDYLNFIEGAKTRIKNLHWTEEDNAKHVYLDELSEDVSKFEDKIAEAGQANFGRFKDGEIVGDDIQTSDPIMIVDLLLDMTSSFRSKLNEKLVYNGEISWVDDFLATLKQSKYRLQLH